AGQAGGGQPGGGRAGGGQPGGGQGGSVGPDSQPPTAPTNLLATAPSTTQVNLSWTASTDDVGVVGYLVERCQGANCATFGQVGGAPSTSYQDPGLTPSATYTYRVRAIDAAGNRSAYSNVVSVTPSNPDTTPPTAPSSLMAMATSPTQIALSWTAATDNMAVSSYLIERCQGAGCATFAQVGTSPAAMFADLGLAQGTSYSYRVRASDAAGNLGPYSAPATATTTTSSDVQPPSAPTGLTATAMSGTQINLAWTAATDDVAVTAYRVERCQGSGCTLFTQIGLSTMATFADTGLAAGVSYSYRVRASDAAGNLGGYSNVATATTSMADTTPPSAPSNLAATPVSGSRISLAWTASTDAVGVTGYLVERCQGAACTNFTQVGTAPGAAFIDNGLSATTTYSYRVRATDAAMNVSPYSNVAMATTKNPAEPPAFVQSNSATPQTAQTSVTIPFTGAQQAGDLNVLFAAWSDGVTKVVSVMDTAGNTYAPALAPTTYADKTTQATQVCYYAKNIVGAAAGTNSVTITFSGPAPFVDARIAEYSGLDPVNPLDDASGGSGVSGLADSGPVHTTAQGDLLVAGNYNQYSSLGAGDGYTLRLKTDPDGDVLEDRIADAVDFYSATVPLNDVMSWWIIQVAAFRSASTDPLDTTAPAVAVTSPAAAATVSGTVPVTVTATDTSGVVGVELLVDGLPMGAPVTTAPYSLSFNSALFANGTHTVQAYAWDRYLNIGYSVAVSVTFSNASPGNPAQNGLWTGLLPSPIVSTASALLPGGKILVWEGQSFGYDARVWTPQFNSFFLPLPPVNLFCAGLEQMADGRIFVDGGHIAGHTGITALNLFDPATESWVVMPEMAFPRWYPTATILPDGRFVVLSGETNCDDCDVTTPEIFDPATKSWTQLTSAQFFFSFYPHAFVLPDGRLLVSSTIETNTVSQVLDVAAGTWTPIGGPAVDGGSAIMYLPGKVLKTGKAFDPDDHDTPSLATAYVLDATQPSPTWQAVAPMAAPLSYHNLTSLPDGTVLVTGGGPTTAAQDTANATLNPEIWSPTTQTFTALASTMNAPRLYHFSAELMPDGRVLVSGGGRYNDTTAPTDQFNQEFFAPPYLFKGPRPVITSAPATLQYGQPFTVQTPDAAKIGSVSLVRYGATTHTVNMSQRYLPLTFTAGTGALTVTAPANKNLAPPGNYMLFILDTNGVPSVSATVHF
ncbi:MAG TPA: fibronectin type III domain-containing protein, partial [Polyangia bacterium]|nr:fibronectin type III domain-containing protein [Polyangia bacterium]